MAKKTDHYSFGDDTDDFNWEDGGFDDTAPAESKGRSPIRTLVGSFTSGVAGAAKNTDTQRRFIKEALPDGYVDTYDGALTAARGIKDVYREAGSELRKVNDETKNAVRKILPHVKAAMPKRMGNALERYAGPDRNKVQSRDYDSEAIGFELDNLFKSNGMDQGTKRRLEEMPVKSTKDAVEMTENIVSNKLQMRVADGMNQLVKLATTRANYFNDIGVKLERKKIELGYRQLFTQNKMLEVQQQTLAYQQSAFKDIIHNTALPDLVKQDQNEVFHDITRRNFYGKLAEPVSNSLSGFVHTMGRKAKEKFKSSAEDFTQNLSMGSDAMELYFEMKQLEAEMEEMNNELNGSAPQTPEQKAKAERYRYLNSALEGLGGMAGGKATQWASGKAAKYIKKTWGDNEQVQRVGLAGKNLVNNAGGYGKSLLSDLYGAGPLGKFFEFIGMDSYDMTKSQSNVLQRSNIDNLRQRAVYTYKTEQTINTVIPGLLSMIHNEIRILRTGDDSLEPVSFDFERDTFSSRGEKRQRILDRVFDSNSIKSARDSGRELIDTLTKGASTELSPTAQEAILKYAFKQASRGEVFNLRDLLSFDSGLDPEVEEEVREWLEREVGISSSDVYAESGNNNAWKSIKADAKASLKYQKLRDKLGTSFNSMASNLPNDFERSLNITGQEDIQMLREMGLAKETSPGVWEYDSEELQRRLAGADIGPQKPKGNPNPNAPNARGGFGGGVSSELGETLNQILTKTSDGNELLKEISSYNGTIIDKLGEGNKTTAELLKVYQRQTRQRGRRGGRGGLWDDETTDRTRGPHDPRGRAFAGGGFTGHGGKNDLAGFTHKGEVVFSKEDVARNGGVASVEALRTGKFQGYASGGVVGGIAPGMPRPKHLSEVFTDGTTSMTEKLIESFGIHFGESNKRIDSVNENLDELVGLVAAGLMPFEGMQFAGAAAAFSKRSWLGKAYRGGKASVQRVAGWAGQIGSLPFKAISGGLKVGGSILSALTGSRDRLVSLGEDAKSKVMDLYTKGSDKIAIAAKDIKSRTLIDVNTGKIIEKIGDITGEVRDQANNVVLSAQDFASGLFSMEKGARLPKLIAGGIKAAGSGIQKLLGIGTTLASLPFRALSLAKRGLSGAMDILNRMPDIYVAGEPHPRLLASLLNNGGYIVSSTGKPVMSIKDLTGEIRNLDGDIVLTHEDLAKGLFDRNGKEVRLLRDKILDGAKKAMMLPISMLGTAGRIALAPLKMLGKLGGGIGGLLTGGKRAVTGVERTNAWLEHIHELLDKRLAKKAAVAGDLDGDGTRDGSALERLNESGKSLTEEVKDKIAAAVPEKKGWMGTLLTLIGGGFASMKAFGLKSISWLRKIFLVNAASKLGGAMEAGGVEGGGRGRRGGRMAGIGRGVGLGAAAYGAYSMMDTANAAEGMLEGTGGEAAAAGAKESEDPSLMDEYGGLAATVGGGIAAEGAYGAYRRRRERQQGGGVDPTDFVGPEDPRRDRGGRGRGGGRMGRIWNATKQGVGNLASRFGRSGAGQLGARGLAGAAGRQLAWQGVRMAVAGTASAVVGFISAPVVLGVAAVAAVAIGGYLAYRYMTKETDVLQNFRMNQYGFKEGDDKRCERLMKLELMLIPHVQISKGSPATLGRGVKVEEVAALFDVDTSNREDMHKLITWFTSRFKPIFLGAVTAYHQITNTTSLHDADKKLTKDQKAKFLSETHITSGGGQNPYMIAASPFADDDEVKLDYGDITSRYKDAVGDIDDLKESGASESPQSTSKANEPKKNWWQSTKDAVSGWWKASKDAASSGWDHFKGVHVKAFEAAKTFGSNVVEGAKSGITKAGDYASNIINKLSGKQSEIQMSVYKGFLNAGFSKNQAMALTAEVGRENDYNPTYVFGGHKDAAKDKNGNPIYNLGFISWNRERRARLIERAKAAGVLVGPNLIAQNQTGMDVMAKFVMEEMQSTHKKGMSGFLADKNIDPESAAATVGKNYIGWAYGQSQLRGGGSFDWKSHDNKRRGHLNALKKQLGPEGASAGGGESGGAAAPAPAKPAGPAFTPFSNQAAAKQSADKANGTAPATINGGSVQQAVSKTTGGDTSVKPDMVGSAQVSKVDAKLVELGRKHTNPQKGVDLQGMNQAFMKLFYAMIGEYFQMTGKGVIITSAFRTIAKQQQLYDEFLARGRRAPVVGRPGKSKHNSGIAIDVNKPDANALNSMGLLKKHRFHRPISSEDWHIEHLSFSRPGETQKAIDNDTKSATKDSSSPAGSTNTVAAPAYRPPNAPESAIIKTVIPSTTSGFKADNLTDSVNNARISGDSDPIRAAVQAQAARDVNVRKEQKRQEATQIAQDAHLKLIEGTNTRLDTIIALLKEGAKQKTAPTPPSAPEPVSQADQQRQASMAARSQPMQMSDPISMKKAIL